MRFTTSFRCYPLYGQVAHALLTRPPLSYFFSISVKISNKHSVRLACVKHAASVHPEPGSNSLFKAFCYSSKYVFILFTFLSLSSFFYFLCFSSQCLIPFPNPFLLDLDYSFSLNSRFLCNQRTSFLLFLPLILYCF